MIVDAEASYLSEEDVAALRVGDTHHIDSGLGGAFKMRFDGHEGDRFVFSNVSPGWEGWGVFRYTIDEVRQHVYDLLPSNPTFREWHQRSRSQANNGK